MSNKIPPHIGPIDAPNPDIIPHHHPDIIPHHHPDIIPHHPDIIDRPPPPDGIDAPPPPDAFIDRVPHHRPDIIDAPPEVDLVGPLPDPATVAQDNEIRDAWSNRPDQFTRLKHNAFTSTLDSGGPLPADFRRVSIGDAGGYPRGFVDMKSGEVWVHVSPKGDWYKANDTF